GVGSPTSPPETCPTCGRETGLTCRYRILATSLSGRARPSRERLWKKRRRCARRSKHREPAYQPVPQKAGGGGGPPRRSPPAPQQGQPTRAPPAERHARRSTASLT